VILGLLIALGALVLGALGGAWIARRIEAAHPPEGAFLTVDGVNLHYREDGPADAPPVLILHGAASNLEEPRLALSEAMDGQRVIYLDRPGLGWSARPDGPWSPEREAALIAAFLTALDIPQAVVVGHSWGGAITMRLAIDHPERVTGLVLVAPALSAWIGEAAWFNKITHAPLIGPLMTRLIAPLTGQAQLEGGSRRAFHPEPLPEGYVAASKLPLFLRPAAWKANAEDMARVNHHLEAQEVRYAEIAAPAIFLAGKGDTVLWSKRHSGSAAARMADAELIYVKGAGHNLHHHHPEKVAEAVREVRRRALRPAGESAGETVEREALKA
jgi:pimeloyl-ACP methyl ester carboxylesterase